jgi:hypothetical protein
MWPCTASRFPLAAECLSTTQLHLGCWFPPTLPPKPIQLSRPSSQRLLYGVPRPSPLVLTSLTAAACTCRYLQQPAWNADRSLAA